MSYDLRIIIYMCGYGLDTAANEFLSTVQAAAKLHGSQHPEKPIAFAIHCAKVWGIYNGTKEMFFDTNDEFAIALDNATGAQQFRNPGDAETINSFCKAVKAALNATKTIFILWGHGGVYFTFSGEPDIREFRQFLQESVNNNSNGFNTTASEALSESYHESIPGSTEQWVDSFLANQFRFVQKESGRLEPSPQLLPATERAYELVKEFKTLQSPATPPVFSIDYTQLGMDEVRNAIALLGQPVDMLIFDNCLMQCADNACTLQNSVGILVGSQDYLYVEDIKTAWEVKTIIRHFDKKIEVIADNLVAGFHPELPAIRLGCWGISSIRVPGIISLQIDFEQLIMLMMQQLGTMRAFIQSARQVCANFTDDGIPGSNQAIPFSMVDVGWFLQNLRHQLQVAPHATETTYKQKVIAAIDKNLAGLLGLPTAVVSASSTGKNRKADVMGIKAYAAQGISLLFPLNKTELDKIKARPAYQTLFNQQSSSEFMNQTGWKNFLEAYCV